MMDPTYRPISPEELQVVYQSAWSIENMAGHGAEDREITYIGSTREGNLVTDYYRDSDGGYWFGDRALLNGQMVSMEVHIFGRPLKKRYRNKKG